MSIVVDAIQFATKHHQHMWRKGTRIPYLTHLYNVCKLLAERNCPDYLLAAALLHDILEDTPVTIEELEQFFGANVAHVVRGATEPMKLEKTYTNRLEKQTWQERKEHTIHFVQYEATHDQLLVILADKTDNMQSIEDVQRLGSMVWDRFNASRESQQWYYESLLTAFELRGKNMDLPVLEDLLMEFRLAVQTGFEKKF